MTMTVFKSNGVGQPITMISLSTFYVHCGNYRKFEVDAENENQARKRFSRVEPAGFTEKDITKIEKKFK